MARSPRRPVRVRAPRGTGREAFLDAALALTDRAWVRLDERGGALSAHLTPLEGRGAGLTRAFRLALDAAREGRAARGAERSLRAAALRRALELAERVDARRGAAPEPLPPERLAEIERLLAEEAAAPRDPALRRTWRESRRRLAP